MKIEKRINSSLLKFELEQTCINMYFERLLKMNILNNIGGDYFEFSKRPAIYLGLWPHQSRLRKRIGLIVYVLTFLSSIIPQVIIFFKSFKYYYI